MSFDRHAYLGRQDDRDDPTLRTHNPRAGWVPRGGGGLNHDPSFYKEPVRGRTDDGVEFVATPGFPEDAYHRGDLVRDDDFDALGASSTQSARMRDEPDPDRGRFLERNTDPEGEGRLEPRRRRSDAVLYRSILDLWESDGELDLGAFPRLALYVVDGEVELRGVAPDEEQRRRVEELAYEVRDVVDVFNMLRVRRGARAPRGRVRLRAKNVALNREPR